MYLVGNPELLGIVWGLREKRSAVQSASGFAELFQGCLEAHLDESGLIWLHVFIWFAEISVGNDHNPPLFFSSWKAAKDLCFHQGEPGDSVFIGLPTKTEAVICVEAAGLQLPPSLRGQ